LAIVFSDYVPTTVAKTQEAARLALTHRLLRETPTPKPGAWAWVGKMRDDPRSAFHLPSPPGGPFVVDAEFVRRWINKYPLKRQEELFAAWTDLARNPLGTQDMTKRGIIKLEKGDPNHYPYVGSTPRGVYACSDRSLISHAPVFAALGAYWRSTMAPGGLADTQDNSEWTATRPIVWGTGCSGLQLGLWFDHVRGAHPDWVYLIYDISKAEASRSNESMSEWERVCFRICRDPDFLKWVVLRREMRISFGKLKVKAQVKNKMGSGDGDTSVCTKADNEAMLAYHFGEPLVPGLPEEFSDCVRSDAMEPPTLPSSHPVHTSAFTTMVIADQAEGAGMPAAEDGRFASGQPRPESLFSDFTSLVLSNGPRIHDSIENWRYAAVVNGDDGCAGGPRGLFDLDAWNRSTAELGFNTTASICEWWQLEFCRNRPWPSSRGTYFSVMIGRLLARLGWQVKGTAEWSPLAVALGLRDHTLHVPFVRVLIQRIIDLSPMPHPVAAPTREWVLRGAGPADPVPATWDMCMALYGLSQDDEERFASLLATATEMPIVLHWPHLRRCLDVDGS
jgi:hypothetical protein